MTWLRSIIVSKIISTKKRTKVKNRETFLYTRLWLENNKQEKNKNIPFDFFQLDLAISSFFENDGMEVAEPVEDISPAAPQQVP
jgi:hypothetical protein